MNRGYENIYKMARQRTSYTQEVAAELLGVSVETVRSYETGNRQPPDGAVLAMIDVYGDAHLGYDHLQQTNPLVRRLYPRADKKSLESAVIKICNQVKKLDVDGLLDIAEDGIIDAQERPQFDAIVAVLRELTQATMALSIIEEGHNA